ncbi:unnamed protein product [Urochloa decumbens]|uniref:RING-type domain-containing protein n=1 Tax=Urochloa decumbens TaxID=240449 RepID=A0ABC8VUN2_9POAL
MDSNYIHRTVVVVAGRRHLVGRPARRQYRRTQDDDDDRPRAAASSMAILGLQEVTPSNALQSECAVCLQDFDPEETLRAMPCSHAFHQQCISDWLRRNGVCPLCRHELPTHQQE